MTHKKEEQREKTYRQRLLRDIVVIKNQTLETTISVYYKRSFDETDSDDENKEESEISNENDEFSKKKQSSLREIDDNDKDEKEQLVTEIRQVVIETRINTKLNYQIIET